MYATKSALKTFQNGSAAMAQPARNRSLFEPTTILGLLVQACRWYFLYFQLATPKGRQ
jgi:hypothetical protein